MSMLGDCLIKIILTMVYAMFGKQIDADLTCTLAS